MRRGDRTALARRFVALVAAVAAIVLVGAGQTSAVGASRASVGVASAGVASAGVAEAGVATVATTGLAACGHRIRHKNTLTRQQIRHRRQRWARLCRQAKAAQQAAALAAAQKAAAEKAAAEQAAAEQAAAEKAAAEQAAAEKAAAEQAAAEQAAAEQAAAEKAAAEQAAAEKAAAEHAAYVASISPTAAPATPCGETTYLKADGTAYTCSFSDEFSGSTLDAGKWTPITTAATGQRTGVECVVDDPDTLAVGDDMLTVTARRLETSTSCDSPRGAFDTTYTGGMVTTSGKYAQTYGRFEMRARFPQATGAGLQSALWMYPQSSVYGAWPASGEIDIAEWFSGYPTLAVPHVHYAGDLSDLFRGSYSCQLGDPTAFHTFVVDWTPASITFVYDGQVCLRNVNWMPIDLLAPAPFDRPFNLLIGNGRGNTQNNLTTADTPFPSALQVDYVRAWS